MIFGKKEGIGQYDYKTLKMIYNGNFKNDLREGNGTLTSYDEKFYYEGEWLDNKMEGNGVLYSSQLGKKNGKGELKLSDGTIYTGEFKNDKYHGKGVLKDEKKNIILKGEFKQGILYKSKNPNNKKEKNDEDKEQINTKKIKKRKSLNPLSMNELKGIQSIKFLDEYEDNEINNEISNGENS